MSLSFTYSIKLTIIEGKDYIFNGLYSLPMGIPMEKWKKYCCIYREK